MPVELRIEGLLGLSVWSLKVQWESVLSLIVTLWNRQVLLPHMVVAELQIKKATVQALAVNSSETGPLPGSFFWQEPAIHKAISQGEIPHRFVDSQTGKWEKNLEIQQVCV